MTDPFETARSASAGMPGHSMSADVGVREALKHLFNEAMNEHGAQGYGRDTPVQKAVTSILAPLRAAALAALNAPTESVKAPEGVTRIVPVEPTKAMLDAGKSVARDAYLNEDWDSHGEIWSAMLAASPTPITADDAVAKERERCAGIAARLGRLATIAADADPAWTRVGAACREIEAAIRSLSPDTEGEGM